VYSVIGLLDKLSRQNARVFLCSMSSQFGYQRDTDVVEEVTQAVTRRLGIWKGAVGDAAIARSIKQMEKSQMLPKRHLGYIQLFSGKYRPISAR
jgi:hypothetical protein